jgi:hypothetical protein
MGDHITHMQSHKEYEKKTKHKNTKAHVSQPIVSHMHPNLVQYMWKVDKYPKGKQQVLY